MKIDVQIIPHGDQRYETTGDWWWDADTLHIRVSELGDPMMNYAVARHEMDEAMLCTNRGILEKAVMDFDLANPESSDPGWEEGAPYHKEHIFAEIGERAFLHEAGIDWLAYEKKCEGLYEKVGNKSQNTMENNEIQTEQSVQPEGVEAETGGQHDENAEHETSGTPSSEGERSAENEVHE